MKKIFPVAIIFIGIIVVLFVASAMFTNYTRLYKEFAEHAKIDLPSLEDSKFEIHKFPFPYLLINQIKQDSKINMQNVEVHFSLLSMLKFSPKISSVKIGEAVIHLDHNDVNFLSHNEFISELMQKGLLSTEMNIGKLSFIESDNDIALVIKNFVSSTSFGATNFSGVINDISKLEGSFNKKDSDILFKLEINDKDYTLTLEETYKNNLLESGKFNLETSQFLNQIIALIPDASELARKIHIDEKVNVTLDIMSADNFLSIKNISINGDSIFGKGEMKLSKNRNEISEINLEFDKIDLSNWYGASLKEFSVSNKRFEFNKNKAKGNISVKNMKFDENNFLSDIGLKFVIDADKLYVQKLSGDINNNGKFALNGIVTQNSFTNHFNGKVTFNHTDLNDLTRYLINKDASKTKPIPFALSADLKISSVDLSAQNLLIKTNDLDLTGNYSIKFIGNSSRANANLRFSKMDLSKEDFPLITEAFNYASGLIWDTRDENYLNKFITVRKINSIANYDLTFDSLVYGNKVYQGVNFNLGISPGRVAVDQFLIKTGDDWIDASIVLESELARPMFNIIIHNGSMESNFLSAPSLLELRNKILDKFDLSKIDLNMNFSMDKLYKDNFSLEKILFQGKNDKNLINIDQLDANLFGGRMKSSGSILLEPYNLNFVYALNSVDIAKIAAFLPKGALASGGVFSASGTWSTRGDKLNEQLYNLYTQSSIVAKNITVSNFSIDDLIEKLREADYNANNFKEDIKKSMLTGKTEISDLKTNLNLNKGIFEFPAITFKTNNTAASASASIDIYKFDINAKTIFSFFLANPTRGRSDVDNAPKMTVTATGDLFIPKKTAETQELEELLKNRNVK